MEGNVVYEARIRGQIYRRPEERYAVKSREVRKIDRSKIWIWRRVFRCGKEANPGVESKETARIGGGANA
jgi:hypothetical protein